MELRPLRPDDLETAAGWLSLDAAPPGWAFDLATGAGLALEAGGELAGLVLVRCLGRVLGLPLLLVEPTRRGRGHGRRLVAAAREEALRRDARSFGLEADPFDAESLARLVRLGFKPAAPLFELQWELPEPAAEAEDDPGDDETATDETDRAEAPPDEALADLAVSLDAGLEPLEWIASLRQAGAKAFGVRSEAGEWSAAALVEEPRDGQAHASIVLLGESEPFACLDALAAELSAAGVRRLRLEVPGRQADALRALLQRGAVPTAHRLRMSLEGFPERADLRRGVLLSWR